MPMRGAMLSPPWSGCSADQGRCNGIQLNEAGRCFAHARMEDQLTALAQLREGRPLDFTAGVPFSQNLLAELLASAPTTEQGSPLLVEAIFAGASFRGTADFRHVTFQGSTRFERASFHGDAWFDGATFLGTTDFGDTSFEGVAGFNQARFQGDTRFVQARFEGAAGFSEARFERIWFSQASFEDYATFGEAHFQRAVWFDRVGFKEDADFREVTFARPLEPGPMVIRGALVLDGVVFTEPVTLEVTCGRLSCRRIRFKAGGHLRVAYAEVDLQAAEVPTPLIIASHTPDALPGQSLLVRPSRAGEETMPPLRRPIVASLERADVGKLTLTDLDLRACRFADAHHLDQLRIEGAQAFAFSPDGWKAGWAWPPVWRWTRRQTLAEEHQWRAEETRKRSGWYPQDCQPPSRPAERAEPVAVVSPERLAVLYRQLRKAQEDTKNEPGAADLYYGEMEMRRKARSTRWPERWVLRVYWAMAGYALRATRALATLLGLLLLATALLALYGLPADNPRPAGLLRSDRSILEWELVPQPPSTELPRTALRERLTAERLERAARASLNAAVFRSAGQQLTVPGQYTEMAVRFLGPVLLGLALLSIRNRVKR